MLMVARSRSEIDLKEAIGQHEFTAKPHALFTVTGDLRPCTEKSKLMTILEEMPNEKKTGDIRVDQQPQSAATDICPLPAKSATVIDGMALVQAMGKPSWIKICSQWADHFIAILDRKTKEHSETHVVFDRYDIASSLKEATRKRRQGGKPPTTYHVEDNTPIGKVSEKLSGIHTKDELTVCKMSRQDVHSNYIDVKHLHSSQEEADTRIILHSLLSEEGNTALH